MKLRKTAIGLVLGLAMGVTASAHADEIEHVLLISVDGLHALDVAHYVESHPNSALAELSRHGITYTNARTPSNSDSFPGLLALVTGGSPVSHGLFYDVSYDRALFDPNNTSCSGMPGNAMVFDESIDKYVPDPADSSKFLSLDIIDPKALPRVLKDGNCVPLYPHDALRTNTIFEVVKEHGGRTAWADKHPAYDLVNGPSGTGVDDLYTPEITNVGGFDATVSVVCTVANDQKKVAAILNEIRGRKHDGSPGHGAPTLFGMNFQAVSVGQKVARDNSDLSCPDSVVAGLSGLAGGYVDGAGTPSKVLQYGLDQTDAALASMVNALKERGIYDSTLFIVSAKHGQSPINPAKVNKPGHFADLVAALPDGNTNPAALAIASAAACSTGACGLVQDDDIALIWLQDQGQSKAVADYLNANAKLLFIEEVLAGDELTLKFNEPAVDSRTPDVIVQPQYGTIYTGSGKKNAEHGGFSFGDTNVGLIVSTPRMTVRVVKTPVSTSQVAATILHALDIDPQELHSVRGEHTQGLPSVSR